MKCLPETLYNDACKDSEFPSQERNSRSFF